ncbi:MAG: hypothetical protein RML47_08200 [Bacteroidota bacterium]|nr:hypothetical protein [Rhodothermia bacterium]MDW8286062.1 hypothetical protein [Bacteroidota bacterium]
MRYLHLLIPSLALVALPGCDVVNETGTEVQPASDRVQPQAQAVEASALRPVSARPLTGQASVLLVGRLEHPLTGALEAQAYLSLEYPTVVLPNLADYQLRAELRLVRQATYGDTTGTLRLRLRLLTQPWSDARFRADTTLPAGEVVGLSAPFSSRDSLVRIPLSASWTALFQAAASSEAEFTSRIHGFALELLEGQAAVGFNAARSFVRIWYSREGVRDSLSLLIKGRANAVRRLSPAPPSALIQGGVGSRVLASFSPSLPPKAAVHRAVVWLYARPIEPQPGRFWEPLRSLELYTSTESGEPDRLLAIGNYREREGGFAFSSSALSAHIQELVLGRVPARPLLVMAASEKATLGWVVLIGPEGEVGRRPRLELLWSSAPAAMTER